MNKNRFRFKPATQILCRQIPKWYGCTEWRWFLVKIGICRVKSVCGNVCALFISVELTSRQKTESNMFTEFTCRHGNTDNLKHISFLFRFPFNLRLDFHLVQSFTESSWQTYTAKSIKTRQDDFITLWMFKQIPKCTVLCDCDCDLKKKKKKHTHSRNEKDEMRLQLRRLHFVAVLLLLLVSCFFWRGGTSFSFFSLSFSCITK